MAFNYGQLNNNLVTRDAIPAVRATGDLFIECNFNCGWMENGYQSWGES